MSNEKKGTPQKLKDLFPTAAINKEILSFLPAQDILSFAGTTHSADQLATESKVLVERIKSEFELNIQTLITLIPANRQPLLLSHARIYRHLTALNKLRWWARNRYAIDDPALFQRALSADVVELPLLYDYLDKAVRVGNLALVQWLMAPERGAQRVNPNLDTFSCAAKSGNLALVQWLMAPKRGAQRMNPSIFILYDAVESGNLALVQWLMAPERGAQRVNPGPGGVTLRSAAELGSLALVQWLMAAERGAQRVNPDVETLHQAARAGKLAVVQWLMAPERDAQRVNPNAETLRCAVRSGNLVVVQWLMAPERGAQRLNPNAETLHEAARSGNLALVQWLMAPERDTQRVNPDVDTLSSAAESGNLALVQWLMAVERGAQRVEPSPELFDQVREDWFVSNPIKLWFEQTLQLREAVTAAPIFTQDTNSYTQRSLGSESKALHSADSHTQQPLSSDSSTRAAEKKERETKHAQPGPPQKLKDLFPTAAINKEILSFLPAQDILSFAATTRSADTLVAQTGIWAEKIKSEFKLNIQTLMPTNRQPLLLSYARIYRHLTALNKLARQVRNRYATDDPALFQRALSADVVELPLLYDYLDKAVRVGNLALVQWLMAPERGAQRVNPDVETLRYAAESGNLALVQWLMAPERGAQRANSDGWTLSYAAQSGNLALVQWLMAPERGAQCVNPDVDTLSSAAGSGNLALVQWLMAPERGAQRVEPNPELFDQVREDGSVSRRIKQWFEQTLQLREVVTAAPVFTQDTSSYTQRSLSSESKALHSAASHTQQPLSSESKPLHTDSKAVSISDGKSLVAGGVQTSSSSTSTTAFSSTVVRAGGSPLHIGGQQTAAASSQEKQTQLSQPGSDLQAVRSSRPVNPLNENDEGNDSGNRQPEPPGKQGNSLS